MPKFAANLTMLFTELPFLERFAAAKAAGFDAVEYLFPYDFDKALLAEQLKQQAEKLEQQARQALAAGREDLARSALERKAAITGQVGGLDSEIQQVEAEQAKLTEVEARLRTKIELFRTQKEVVKAQYSAAEAQVKIGDAVSGLSEELSDIGLTIDRARDKTDQLRARASAIDELTASGVLNDLTAPGSSADPIEGELRKIDAGQRVEADLERLKKEVAGA